MFARVVALLPLALLASASRLAARDYCRGSELMYCCNELQTINQANDILDGVGLLNSARATRGLVGITCSPFTGQDCSAQQQRACCVISEFGGEINLGCAPPLSDDSEA